VQLNAPSGIRGRIIGLFSTFSLGCRAFSGITVGLLGAVVGIHRSLAVSAVLLFAIVGIVLTVRTPAETTLETAPQ
jgi:hypothetical protein